TRRAKLIETYPQSLLAGAVDVMKIYLLQNRDSSVESTNVRVVTEGITVLGNLWDFSRGCCSLLGLSIRNSFEAFQKDS
uniref:Uncharacterized protein n=1 Tax=Xiphophorus couchianus TaxID=32473 RepID=A0A3B5MKH4_9TELE